jgi:hypothetical protein
MAAKSVRFPALALSRSGSKGISHPQCRLFDRAHCRTPALAAHKIHRLRSGFNRQPGAAAVRRSMAAAASARAAGSTPRRRSAFARRGRVRSGATSRAFARPQKNFAAAVISGDVVRLFGSSNPCCGEI